MLREVRSASFVHPVLVSQAEAQSKVDKKRDKQERKILDTQVR